MALGPFAISHPRTQVAAFPPAIFVFPHRVYLPRPTGSSNLSDFVRLFQPWVWLAIFFTGLIGSLSIRALSMAESSLKAGNEKFHHQGSFKSAKAQEESSKHVSTFFNIFLKFLWGVLYQEGSLWERPGIARIVIALFFLGAFILMTTYSGLLVATLTVPAVHIPIKSVQGLVSQHKIPWRLEQGGIILHTFKTADVKMYKTLLEGSAGFFPDCYASRKEIARGEFAGICDTLSGDLMVVKAYTETGRCEYFVPKENIVSHSYSLVLQKKSPLMDSLSFWLQELQERGWVQQLINQLLNNGTQCNLPPGKEGGTPPPTPLGIWQMWGAFVIIGACLGATSVVFLAEIIAHMLKNINQ